jgi:transposase
MRDTRCHSSAEVIEKALTGHYRAEHLFVLEQALALYDVYSLHLKSWQEGVSNAA